MRPLCPNAPHSNAETAFEPQSQPNAEQPEPKPPGPDVAAPNLAGVRKSEHFSAPPRDAEARSAPEPADPAAFAAELPLAAFAPDASQRKSAAAQPHAKPNSCSKPAAPTAANAPTRFPSDSAANAPAAANFGVAREEAL